MYARVKTRRPTAQAGNGERQTCLLSLPKAATHTSYEGHGDSDPNHRILARDDIRRRVSGIVRVRHSEESFIKRARGSEERALQQVLCVCIGAASRRKQSRSPTRGYRYRQSDRHWTDGCAERAPKTQEGSPLRIILEDNHIMPWLSARSRTTLPVGGGKPHRSNCHGWLAIPHAAVRPWLKLTGPSRRPQMRPGGHGHTESLA